MEVVENSFLSFECSNEYPVPGSLQFYENWTHVVEPWRNTTLTAVGALHGSILEWEVTYTREGDDSVKTLPVYGESTAGSSDQGAMQQSSFVAPHAGQWYDITLTEHMADGKLAVTTGRALGKYVRREIRSLTEEDRMRYFDALTQIHSLGLEEGQAKYGTKFANQEVFLIKHLAQDTLAQCNFFHGCAGFLTGHAGFQLQFEQSLQAIDPSIAAPYWDPSVDDTVYGKSWHEESPMVTNEWFGPQQGNPDNNYILDEGRFAYTVIPTDATAAEHNAYGRLTQTYNNDPAQYVWRSASVCGLPSEARLPGCTALKGMLEKDTLDDFREKMETDWHGTLHPSLGGAVDCPYSFTDLLTPHPEWSELLEFVSMLTEVVWDVAHATGDMVCPSVCSDETPFEECSCSCPSVDVEALNRSTAYTFLDEMGVLDRYYGCQRGPRFMNYTEPDWDPDFVSPVSKAVSDQGGKEQDRIKGMYLFQLNETHVLSEEDQEELLVWLARAACHPGRVSPFMTPLAATNDPLFWVAHASFERIWAAKRLLPEFKDSFDQVRGGVQFNTPTPTLSRQPPPIQGRVRQPPSPTPNPVTTSPSSPTLFPCRPGTTTASPAATGATTTTRCPSVTSWTRRAAGWTRRSATPSASW